MLRITIEPGSNRCPPCRREPSQPDRSLVRVDRGAWLPGWQPTSHRDARRHRPTAARCSRRWRPRRAPRPDLGVMPQQVQREGQRIRGRLVSGELGRSAPGLVSHGRRVPTRSGSVACCSSVTRSSAPVASLCRATRDRRPRTAPVAPRVPVVPVALAYPESAGSACEPECEPADSPGGRHDPSWRSHRPGRHQRAACRRRGV